MAGLPLEEIQEFIDTRHPKNKRNFKIEAAGKGTGRVRMIVEPKHLRSGGTVSGPTLMWLTDAAMYFTLLAELGPVWTAVTTNLNISFLRKPPLADLIAEINLLKVGKRLAFGEFRIYSEGDTEAVAHGTITYSIPPREVWQKITPEVNEQNRSFLE